MKMTFRWFGSNDDSITLAQIRQIPGVTGVAGTLPDIPAGEVWPRERIAALKKEVEDVGLTLEVIESVNIHDSIKTGPFGQDGLPDGNPPGSGPFGRDGISHGNPPGSSPSPGGCG
jgi:mannonate dehydratase